MEKKLRDVLPSAVTDLLGRIDNLVPEDKKVLRDELQKLLSKAKNEKGKLVVEDGRETYELDASEVSEVFAKSDGDRHGDRKIRKFVDDSRLYAVLYGRIGKEETDRFIEGITKESQNIIDRCISELTDLLDDAPLETMIEDAEKIEGKKEEYDLHEHIKRVAELEALGTKITPYEEDELKSKRELIEKMKKDGITPKEKPKSSTLDTQFEMIYKEPQKFGLTKDEAKKIREEKDPTKKLEMIKNVLAETKQKKVELLAEIEVEENKKELLGDSGEIKEIIKSIAEHDKRRTGYIEAASRQAISEFNEQWKMDKRNIGRKEMRKALKDKYKNDNSIRRRIKNLFLIGDAKDDALSYIEKERKEAAVSKVKMTIEAEEKRAEFFGTNPEMRDIREKEDKREKIVKTKKHGDKKVFHDGGEER